MVTSTVRKIEEKNDFLLVGARCKKTWFAGPHVFFNLQLRMLLKARKLRAYFYFYLIALRHRHWPEFRNLRRVC